MIALIIMGTIIALLVCVIVLLTRELDIADENVKHLQAQYRFVTKHWK